MARRCATGRARRLRGSGDARVLTLVALLLGGGALARDGGRPAPVPPDAGPADAGTADALEADAGAPASQLEQEVAALQALVAGHVPEALRPQALFEVTLTDEAAVAARVQTLSRQLEGAGADDGGAPSLTLTRNRLRLQFLSLPAAQRSAVLAEADRKNKLQLAQAEARAAQERAAEAEKAAEEARLEAVEQARQSQTAGAEALATERARMLAALEQLANLRHGLATRRAQHADEAARRLTDEARFASAAADEATTPDQAATLYDELGDVAAASRNRLHAALDELATPTKLVSFEPRFDFSVAPWRGLGDAERQQLKALLAQVRAAEAGYRDDEKSLRLQMAGDGWVELDTLNGVRLKLLRRLPSARRDELLGPTREGVQELASELDQLVLTSRWYPRRRLAEVKSLTALVQDFVSVGLAGLTAFKLLALLVVAWLVRQRWRRWVQRLRGMALRRLAGRPFAVAADRWFRAVLALGGPAGLVAFVYGFFAFLPVETVAELAFLRAVVVGYAWYALAIATVHQLLTSAASSRRAELSQALSDRVLHSVRVAGRAALIVVVSLVVSERVLGRGALYELVIDASWLVGVTAAWLLLRSWRSDIAIAYVESHPEGRLARVLKSTEKSALGLAVAAVAFVAVAGHGVSVWARHSLLRFDQTRKALAFVFRRQMEKHAETVGRGVADVSLLPQALRDAFTEGPPGEVERIPHYTGMDTVLESLEAWREGKPGRAFALVGEQGIGKTSWLEELARRAKGGEVVGLTLLDRLTTAREVIEVFNKKLSLDAHDLDELVEALRTGPRRVLLVDHGQNLVLKAVGGLGAFEAFARVVVRVAEVVPIVCAFSKYSWQYLEAVTQNRNIFRDAITLEPWREEDIDALIEARMKQAGVEASFEDLVVERQLDGTAFDSEVIRTAARYIRLLWDYSDGNPRVAVHFWLRSLVPDGEGEVRVRLFEAPAADELDHLGQQSRFLLAAVVTHENIDVDELVRVLRYPKHQLASAVEYLRTIGLVTVNEGRVRISTHWNRAVLRHLRRKHLLYGD